MWNVCLSAIWNTGHFREFNELRGQGSEGEISFIGIALVHYGVSRDDHK